MVSQVPNPHASPIVISHYQARPILAARKSGSRAVQSSLDLGISNIELSLEAGGLRLPDGLLIPWSKLEKVAGHDVGCFAIEDGEVSKIQLYSEELNRVYTLMPTSGAPTMLISGLPMHRIKDVDPWKDTLLKIRAIKPAMGKVLDTCTGLGYTAIAAARKAQHVTTFEIDSTVLDICRMNPWSRELFDNPKIDSRVGDIYEEIVDLPEGSFSHIIHDPPTFSLAGELYSSEFYGQLFRVLRYDGRLLHYIGDLKSKSGSRTAKGAVQRLKDSGFRRVSPRQEAFGIVAQK